jgi:hypothetical protein
MMELLPRDERHGQRIIINIQIQQMSKRGEALPQTSKDPLRPLLWPGLCGNAVTQIHAFYTTVIVNRHRASSAVLRIPLK